MDIRIYCAGPFGFQYKDYSKEKIAKDYRSILVGNPDKIIHEGQFLPTFRDNMRVKYNGPFYFYEDQKTAADIVKEEKERVEEADVVFFYFRGNANCPGTVTELINAAMLKKRMVIVYEPQSNTGEPENDVDSSVWYPLMFVGLCNKNASLHRVSNQEEALEVFIDYLHNI